MDYSKFRVLQSQHNKSNEAMGEIIGISGVGYNKMIEKRTATVSYLEKIAAHFNKPVTFFFEEHQLAQEHRAIYNCQDCKQKNEKIKQLETLLKENQEELTKVRKKNQELYEELLDAYRANKK